MGRYFGTDGFRGEANVTLTADHAYQVGRFLGWYYNALRERNGNNEPASFAGTLLLFIFFRSLMYFRIRSNSAILS